MKAHVNQHRIAALCEALSVSRSGYYAWLVRPQRHTELTEAIGACYKVHKATVGVPSVHAELAGSGFDACVRTVGRHMQRLGV